MNGKSYLDSSTAILGSYQIKIHYLSIFCFVFNLCSWLLHKFNPCILCNLSVKHLFHSWIREGPKTVAFVSTSTSSDFPTRQIQNGTFEISIICLNKFFLLTFLTFNIIISINFSYRTWNRILSKTQQRSNTLKCLIWQSFVQLRVL